MRHSAVIFLTLLLFTGCSGGLSAPASPVVRDFGSTLSPDGSKRLEVTRREKSLVVFEVIDSSSGKRLVNDSIGSDAMRWFLYWETPSKLWGYGSDIGYFMLFEFTSDGTVEWTKVDETMVVPKPVWDNLPSSLQRKYEAQQVGASNP